jgi:copper chaperone NosL
MNIVCEARRGARVRFAALIFILACASEPLAPANLDVGHHACDSCRMIISDRRFAAQIVARGHEPRFFDDIGCLASKLRETSLPAEAVVFVSDYDAGGWIRADQAHFLRCVGVNTPMGSAIIATTRGMTSCQGVERVEVLGR